MDELECRLIRELQQDLPLTANPYVAIAHRLNISEQELVERVRRLLADGVIRKMGAVLRHRRVGYTANALCVWQVPEERVTEVGELFASLPVVTHCYERLTHKDWPYNLYTMVHALSRKECEDQINKMSAVSGLKEFRIFYSTKELKKTSMRYFE